MIGAIADVWHTFQGKIAHHEFEEMEIDVEHSRSDNCTKISVKVDDGSKSRITFTIEELRALIALGERFENAQNIMKGITP